MKIDEKKWRNIISESDQKLKNIKTRMDTFKDNLLLNKIVFMKGSVEKFTKLNAASLLARADLATSNSTDSNTSSNSNSPSNVVPLSNFGSTTTTTQPASTGLFSFTQLSLPQQPLNSNQTSNSSNVSSFSFFFSLIVYFIKEVFRAFAPTTPKKK